MSLARLKLLNLRNLEPLDIAPCEGLNLIVGPNASGKTSLLEAVHVLGRGRSFRSGRLQSLIRYGAEELTVYGELQRKGGRVAVGVERTQQGLRARIAGRDVQSTAELAAHLPLLLINPDSHRLLEEGPRYRRQFLDWGVFHVEPRFLPAWSQYERALRQRNALLRAGAPASELGAWGRELAAAAAVIDAQRRAYLDGLREVLPGFLRPLVGLEGLEVVYQSGWPAGTDYPAALEAGLDRDRAMGHTQYGPHRAELLFKVGGMAAAERVSRGQQKALVLALRLAQGALLKTRTDVGCVLLIDDLPAEFDAENRVRALDLVRGLGLQSFVTAIEADLVPVGEWAERRVFHVEHGSLREVV
jgi:DNA replication and repair protein RecF